MIGSGDDVDRMAKNPNRVTQPFDMIGKGEDMSEIEARDRYWWSKIRQALKAGNIEELADVMDRVSWHEPHRYSQMQYMIAKTFTAGCTALGDPAPTDKEQERICKNCQSWRQFSGKKDGYCSASLDQGFGAVALALDDEGIGTDSDFGCVRFVAEKKEQEHE